MKDWEREIRESEEPLETALAEIEELRGYRRMVIDIVDGERKTIAAEAFKNPEAVAECIDDMIRLYRIGVHWRRWRALAPIYSARATHTS